MSDDKKRDLYRKYAVSKLDDFIGKHDDCDYYVLDLVHDRFAEPALKAYADACEAEFPDLARDIRARFAKPTGGAP